MSSKNLPPRPSLEQYRKQAKDLVKRMRAGDAEAIQRVKQHHPRLGRLSDEEFERMRFALADAQLTIAAEHGFPNWATFAKHLATFRPASSPPSHFSVPADAEIEQILIQRVDNYRRNVGLVVGVIEPRGRRIVATGVSDLGKQQPLHGDTVFEIGSITTVCTALLLMEMVHRGEVRLSDPVDTYVPSTMAVPRRNGRQITLHDLATHRSGLPRLPTNFRVLDRSNPYVDYSLEQLYEFLSTYELPRDIGSQFEFSIVGFGLLGHALERRAGMDYESLLRARVLDPLGMTSTRIILSDDMRARLATGYNGKLEPVPNWDIATLAGAGALRSTANELLTLLGAVLDYRDTPLRPVVKDMLQAGRASGMHSPLGWMVVTLDGVFVPDGHRIAWMNGATAGYRAFVGFDAVARTGVVVLGNTMNMSGLLSGTWGPDDIGLHFLDARFPLNAPLDAAKEQWIARIATDGGFGKVRP